jgi:ankyrin repeat protein
MPTLSFLFGRSKNKPNNNELLLQAAEDGNVDKVQKLLDKGANIEATNDDGWTPLHWACRNGCVEVVEMLLDKRANIEARDNGGWTPLHEACYKGHVEVVKLLLDKGTNIEATDDDLGWTPLHAACFWGRVEVVEMLLARGANAEATDNNGKTPLDLAKATRRSKRVVEVLTAHLNAKNSQKLQRPNDDDGNNFSKGSSESKYLGASDDTHYKTGDGSEREGCESMG